MWKKMFSVLGLIAILIAASIGGQIGKEVGNIVSSPTKPSQQEVEAVLIKGFSKGANQLNQRLPMMVDEETRLDKATVGPGVMAVYHHTLLKYTSRDIDVNWVQTNLRSGAVQKVCAIDAMKKSLQYGGIYAYAYSGSDGVEITRFEIDRNDCGFQRITPY